MVRFIITALILLVIGFYIFKFLTAKHIKAVFYLIIGFMLTIGCVALPIAKSHVQDGYKSVYSLKMQNLQIIGLGYNDYVPLFSIDNLAPEVIYSYGEKIPSLKTKEGYIIPEERKIAILSTHTNPESIEVFSKLYDIKVSDTYDLNTSPEGSRGHKSRLLCTLYKLTRKATF